MWHVSGDGIEKEGVLLLPNPTRIYDTPMLTFWHNGQYGRVFQGFGIDNRDSQLGWQVYGGEYGTARDWRLTDSLFRMSWAYDRLGRLEFHADDSKPRFLELQLLEAPESYTGEVEGGKDPHLRADATVITKVGGPNPNWQGYPEVITQNCEGESGTLYFEVDNDGDMETWVKWTVSSETEGTQYVFPDYSLGEDEYLRAEADATRTWRSPILMAGEHCVFTPDPRMEFADSNISTNVWARCKSQLLYPIPPHTKVTLPVQYSGATTDDKVRLTYQNQYSRPFGVSYSREVIP